MRSLWIGAFAMFVSCTEQNRILVHTGRIDDVSHPDVGDDVEFLHLPTEGYAAQKPGFYTVHDTNDWLFIWKDPRPDAKPPPPPREVDWKKEMLFVATAATENALAIHVKKIIDQTSGVHVYVQETLSGPNCPVQPGTPPPMDIVALRSIAYDVHVHHDRVRAEECGPPPDAVAVCRVAGSGAPGGVKLTASAGQTVDCDASQSKPHTGSIVDRGWQLATKPDGSTTKLTVGNQGMGVTFVLDAWGTYGLGLEVRDGARSGGTTATIDAPPPQTGVPIELHWTGYDRNDDASMYPKVELHVAELGSANDCGPATAKPWCEVQVVGTVQHAHLRPEPGKQYRAFVTYQDFRLKGSPVACVRLFPKGRPSFAVCDESLRNAGAVWEAGAIDEATSSLYDPKKGKPAPVTPVPVTPVTGADAGAPAPVRKLPF